MLSDNVAFHCLFLTIQKWVVSNKYLYKSLSGDEIPECDVTYIILSVYSLITEL